MREMSKMAELKFEAPLAQFESEDLDFGEFASNTAMSISDMSFKDMSSSVSSEDSRNSNHQVSASYSSSTASNSPVHQLSELDNTEAMRLQQLEELGEDANSNAGAAAATFSTSAVGASNEDLLNETFSGSLEDLVNTFDDKITKCFGNFDESVEKLAPVQVRSQEEIMNECQ